LEVLKNIWVAQRGVEKPISLKYAINMDSRLANWQCDAVRSTSEAQRAF